MGKIRVTIEKGADLFSAWADKIPGIYGESETVKETKENVLAAIALYKGYNDVIPSELEGIELEFIAS